MFRRYTYFLLCAVLLLVSCGEKPLKKKTNWKDDFAELSKNPYSLYLAYKSLPLLFPGATVEKQSASARIKTLGYRLRNRPGTSLIMLVGNSITFNDDEIDSLLSYAEAGHQVMVAVSRIDAELLTRLNVRKSYNSLKGDDTVQQFYLSEPGGASKVFSCKYRPGHALHGAFDPRQAGGYRFHTLGTNGDGKPDCIVFSVGKGKLFLHATPVVFSNYFLLQQHNRRYLELLFGNIAEPVNHIYFWSFNARTKSFSDWGVIWNNKATRLALLLALFALGVYIIFEMKRRQRIIPIIAPLENTSVAFVETIGRLYYNKKDHGNLAAKIVQHFLDFVRSNYYLNTNILDEEFTRNLAAKSGRSLAESDTLVRQIKEIQEGHKVDEAYLYALHTQIQDFYHGK